jgi:predicted ribosome quality control (RQC) complex YloA/Tae2 family protein
MDIPILQKIAVELDELLVGGFVNKIHQPLPRDIVLRIRAPRGGEKKLMISADPALGRIHLTEMKIANPPTPPRFCAFLRAHFQGSKILAVRAAADDRVVRIVGSRGPEGERTEKELILELLGRDSNILLIDGSSHTILDCLHRIPQKETGSRIVMPGTEYVPPPPRAGVQAPQSLFPESGDLIPAVSEGPKGKKRLVLGPMSKEDEVFPSMNAAADAFSRPKLESAMLEALRRELAAPLKARVKSLERRMQKIQADSDRLKQLVQRQQDGELLKGNLSRVKKGMDSIELQDWATGNGRVISLDPALNAVTNMERIFKKAAKGKRGEQKVLERQRVTLEEKRAVEDILYYVGTATDIAELESVTSDYHVPGPKKDASRHTHKVSPQESTLYHRFPIAHDRAILVGKSAAGNDFLLRRKAKTGDLWLHVKDFPGAHVLLPADKRNPPSREETEYAAACAAHFSKARAKGKVEIIVASCADVEALRGGFKGQVRVKKHWTVMSDGLLAQQPWPM